MVEHVAYEIWKDGKKDNDALTYQDLTVADCADGYEARPLVYLSDYAELEAENVRQSSDIAEFMRRLGPRWFLEQGWFPESMEASDDL